MSKLISIGELLIDFSSIGTGPLKDINQFKKNAGGAPANVCVQAAKLGQKAIYLTQVGKDGFGDFLIDTLKKEGVDTSFIKQSESHQTSLAFVSFKENGEREFSFYRFNAADLFFKEQDFKDIEFKEGDFLEFGSVALKTEEALNTHLALINKAKEKKATICFDPNIRLNLWEDSEALKNTIHQFLAYADIVKVSDEELMFITDCVEEQQAIEKLLQKGISLILVTKGDKGANLYLANKKLYTHPGIKVDAVDTTGAGDSFFGGFLTKLLDYHIKKSDLFKIEYEDILTFACKCGAYTTTSFGAIPAMGNKIQIESVGK